MCVIESFLICVYVILFYCDFLYLKYVWDILVVFICVVSGFKDIIISYEVGEVGLLDLCFVDC